MFTTVGLVGASRFSWPAEEFTNLIPGEFQAKMYFVIIYSSRKKSLCAASVHGMLSDHQLGIHARSIFEPPRVACQITVTDVSNWPKGLYSTAGYSKITKKYYLARSRSFSIWG